jgi:hypothetical protein
MLAPRLLAPLSLAALTAACNTMPMGPAPPRGGPPPAANFSAADFAWSRAAGKNALFGQVGYRQGQVRYSCAGATVVLTPETTWSRRRMAVLYGSTERAALPPDEVRARTPSAPPGDPGPFVRRTTCDATGRFNVSGLPDGGWFVITVARPAGSASGESMAVMRRVVTRGGKVHTLAL